MKAWLVTWEWMAKHAEVIDMIAAVVNPRKPQRYVAEIVEHIYSHHNYHPSELFDVIKSPKSNPYRATTGDIINGVPHGERIMCGDHPWLYARKVSNLRIIVDKESGFEVISWKEPANFKWKNKDKLEVEVGRPPIEQSYRRTVIGRLNNNLKYKREEL
jgi:hypothetical protein